MTSAEPIPMLLWCPCCGARHIDRAEFATKVHHTHACQECGHVWRPAIVPTLGVQFLPGFRNEDPEPADPVGALLEQWKKTRGTLWTTQIAELEAAFAAQKAGAQ
jgi:rubredoxin